MLLRQKQITAEVAAKRLQFLEVREIKALADLRAILKDYRSVTQERVAAALRVDRTMVSKVWNGGRPGRWIRSSRVVGATYRALEAAGWSPAAAEVAP